MSKKENRTAADIPVLEGGVSNIAGVADEARALMADFKGAVAEYGNVFGSYTSHAGAYRGSNGGDFAEIWNKVVVPGQAHAMDFLSQLDGAIGDVGTQTKGVTKKLSESNSDANKQSS
ncbi:hypothetical protein [Amycolatopsis minnesotensis]|uniref:WXG100 family type VII secretion target n=1 Tax=Amycolatopsis minnesotensis TaxID=337894 RepID=A0ABN2S8E4_9PSEU